MQVNEKKKKKMIGKILIGKFYKPFFHLTFRKFSFVLRILNFDLIFKIKVEYQIF